MGHPPLSESAGVLHEWAGSGGPLGGGIGNGAAPEGSVVLIVRTRRGGGEQGGGGGVGGGGGGLGGDGSRVKEFADPKKHVL